MLNTEQKLEQREQFIDEIYSVLVNSCSKAAIVSILEAKVKSQIEAQKLGVI